MFGIGGFELFLILLFGFLIFGPDKLPAMAKTLGKAIAKFRNAQEEMSGVLKGEMVFDKDAEDPFKNPLDALDEAAAKAKKRKKIIIGSVIAAIVAVLVIVGIVFAILVSLFLNRTRAGLNLRAVGESPATADAAGINVTAYKYLATCVGSAVTGLGGVFYTMNYVKGTWANDGSIEGLGWLALALVIFASWRSLNTIWGSYLFGILYWLFFYIGGLTRYSQELFKMLPYVVTIIVLVVTSMRKKKENMGPAALGLSYFREDR